MFIEILEYPANTLSTYNSDDFRRVQKVILPNGEEIVCVTFKDGGEILFNTTYDYITAKLRK